MDSYAIQPGTVLADRYVVEDQLEEEGGSDSWRAHDKVLARSVVVQILPSSSPRAADMLDAAKRASLVTDPRILQVLDAFDDGRLSYVVREWVSGRSLDIVLGDGPLPARRAARLVAEVSAAIASAHRVGLPHQRLAPDTVVVTPSSGIKVIGLGTFAALRAAQSPGSDDPELSDARDLGRLLYACLTARWPGGPCGKLPAAPTEHDRLLRPRQVRAGVPRALDTLCDRILGDPPRAGRPITTVDEVRSALGTIVAGDGFAEPSGPQLMAALGADRETGAPALFPSDTGGPITGDQPAVALSTGSGDSRTRHTLLLVVVAVLVVGGLLLAYLVGRHGLGQTPAAAQRQTTSEPPTESAVQPTAHPIQVQAATAFDPPPGNGTENSDEADLAIDSSDRTAWSTVTYFNNPRLGGLKPGVGLVLDLGRRQAVGRVSVRLVGAPTGLQLRAAPADAVQPPVSSAGFQTVANSPRAGTLANFPLAKPVMTRYLLLWLTSLPNVGGNRYSGAVADVRVLG